MNKSARYIYSIYAIITFVILMFIAVIFVLFASVFGKDKGGDMVYAICRIWAATWYFLIGIRHKNIFDAAHDNSRQYIFVANHHSYQDIPTLLLTVQQKMRVLGKSELAKVPIFGFIYSMAAVLVDRQSAEKRAQSVMELKKVIASGKSIFIFPEGTFNESDNPLKPFYDGAFRIAIETQTNIKPVIFPDTVKRMHWSSIFKMTPGKNRSIFLQEVDVTGYTSSDIKKLKEEVYLQMEKAIIRYR